MIKIPPLLFLSVLLLAPSFNLIAADSSLRTPDLTVSINAREDKKSHIRVKTTGLNGKLSYPSVVFLNEKFEIIQVLAGYRKADEFLKIITFIGEDHYLTSSWEDFSKTYQKEASNGD